MNRKKIEQEIEKLCQENISYKGLAIPYRTGLKMFKADVVNFISSNFCVSGNVSEQIPTTWLDPLLTGKDKVIGEHPYNGKDITTINCFEETSAGDGETFHITVCKLKRLLSINSRNLSKG